MQINKPMSAMSVNVEIKKKSKVGTTGMALNKSITASTRINKEGGQTIERSTTQSG
jgi:hypothetical protein